MFCSHKRVALSASVQRGGGLLRRRGTFSVLTTTRWEGKAGIKSRSLPPDDPFGERSTWQDPGEGVYAAWQAVDQEGFVTAAESAEVRKAHFGPEWSRFTTVGRLSVKKMQEDPRHQSRVEGDPSVYPSAEEVHARELAQRRKMMSHNYSTYEEFLAAEMGGGNARGDIDDYGEATLEPLGELGRQRADPSSALYVEAQMEEAFSVVDGIDGKDRMALRSPEREALTEAEAAAEGEDDVELPPFMLQKQQEEDPGKASTVPEGAVAAAEATRTEMSGKAGGEGEVAGAVPTEIRRPLAHHSTSASVKDAPEAFVAKVLASLPTPHGDASIPLIDPINWDTSHILRFLQLFEHCEDGSSSSLDDSMIDAFHLAKVDGQLLLNVVTPPRLFRVLRRWHVRRQEAVVEAWQHRCQSASGDGEEETIRAATAKAAPKLQEAVSSVTPLLIQETILLCFPYAR